MKRFLIKLTCFLALQFAILAPLAYLGGQYQASRHYLCATQDKLARLATADGPRIIFIGGSNLAFGLDSSVVAKRTGYNPVNMGVHVSLGMLPQMRMVEKHLKPGDLIVLCPEYHLFNKNGMRSTEKIAGELHDVWPGSRPFLQPDHDASLRSFGKPPLRLLADRIAHARKYFNNYLSESEPGLYERGSFNEFGDHVAHYGVAYHSDDRDIGGVSLDLGERNVREAIEVLNEFAARCETRGASVVFAHVPISSTDVARQPQVMENFESILAAELQCPILTKLDQLIFEEDMFFDTEYHLTRTGVTKRTSVVCAGLVEYQKRVCNLDTGHRNLTR